MVQDPWGLLLSTHPPGLRLPFLAWELGPERPPLANSPLCWKPTQGLTSWTNCWASVGFSHPDLYTAVMCGFFCLHLAGVQLYFWGFTFQALNTSPLKALCANGGLFLLAWFTIFCFHVGWWMLACMTLSKFLSLIFPLCRLGVFKAHSSRGRYEEQICQCLESPDFCKRYSHCLCTASSALSLVPSSDERVALTVPGTLAYLFSPGPHLDGPVQCWPPPAQDEQTQDGDAVAEVVDEGHVVDECVRVSHKHDHRGGPALGEDLRLTAGLPPAFGPPTCPGPSCSGQEVERIPTPSPFSTACPPQPSLASSRSPPLLGGPGSTCCLAGVPQLTQTRRAGMGVQRLTWIIASRLGKCPSRAPEKHSLGVGTEGVGAMSPASAPSYPIDPGSQLWT